MTYNPTLLHRKVRYQQIEGSTAIFKTKSFTSNNPVKPPYDVRINLTTKLVSCNCPHFQHRLAYKLPTIFSPPENVCKHLQRALDNLARHDMLPIKCCFACRSTEEPLSQIANEYGIDIPGEYLCKECLTSLHAVANTAHP